MHGMHRSDSATRREKRRSYVESIFNQMPVLPFGLEVARTYAELWADLAARGGMVGVHDLQIGATALYHGLQVATKNPRDFRRIPGLAVVEL